MTGGTKHLLLPTRGPATLAQLYEAVLLAEKSSDFGLLGLPTYVSKDHVLEEPARLGPPVVRRARSKQRPIKAQQAK